MIRVSPRWQETPLTQFWHAQQADDERRARALEVAVQTISQTNFEDVGKTMIEWLKPLAPSAFEPHLAEIENALESPLFPVKRWAMSALTNLEEFDRERAAQIASEALWSENAGLAKDAAKFLSVVALQDENAAKIAWDALNDASALENIGLCEAVYRALVKIKSKRKSLELSEAAREKLSESASAQSERFGKFAGKLK